MSGCESCCSDGWFWLGLMFAPLSAGWPRSQPTQNKRADRLRVGREFLTGRGDNWTTEVLWLLGFLTLTRYEVFWEGKCSSGSIYLYQKEYPKIDQWKSHNMILASALTEAVKLHFLTEERISCPSRQAQQRLSLILLTSTGTESIAVQAPFRTESRWQRRCSNLRDPQIYRDPHQFVTSREPRQKLKIQTQENNKNMLLCR